MKHLWQRPEATVADLVACVSETFRLAYTSVLTTVRTPKRKGYVRHRQDQRDFVYAACVAQEDASKTATRNVLSRSFGNLRERLLLSLLGEEELTAAEVQAPKDAIENARIVKKSGSDDGNVVIEARVRTTRECSCFERLGSSRFHGGCCALPALHSAGIPSVRHTIWMLVYALLVVLPFTSPMLGSSRTSAWSSPVLPRLDARWTIAALASWMVVSMFRAVQLLTSSFKLRRIWRRAPPDLLFAELARLSWVSRKQTQNAMFSPQVSESNHFAALRIKSSWLFIQL